MELVWSLSWLHLVGGAGDFFAGPFASRGYSSLDCCTLFLTTRCGVPAVFLSIHSFPGTPGDLRLRECLMLLDSTLQIIVAISENLFDFDQPVSGTFASISVRDRRGCGRTECTL